MDRVSRPRSRVHAGLLLRCSSEMAGGRPSDPATNAHVALEKESGEGRGEVGMGKMRVASLEESLHGQFDGRHCPRKDAHLTTAHLSLVSRACPRVKWPTMTSHQISVYNSKMVISRCVCV
jgi:hypothetical protein